VVATSSSRSIVRNKRPSGLESPLDTKYWIVTVDFRFLGFDAFKTRKQRESVQTCLHPSTLIQMLQFWIPRTARFEEAMLSSMRLPFLFHEFDPNTEKVTIRILEALGRFANVGDLSKETITAILMKDVLRQKLSGESDVKKQVELIREALIEENQKTLEKLKQTKEGWEALDKKVHEKDEMIRRIERQMGDEKAQFGETRRLLEEERKERAVLMDRFQQLEKELAETKQDKDRARRIRRFSGVYILFPILLIVFSGFTAPSVFTKFLKLSTWQIRVGVWMFMLAIWIWLTHRAGLKNEAISDTRAFALFHKFKVLLFSLVGAVFLKALGNGLWEWIKQVWQLLQK
jgi:hypothetical protein